MKDVFQSFRWSFFRESNESGNALLEAAVDEIWYLCRLKYATVEQAGKWKTSLSTFVPPLSVYLGGSSHGMKEPEPVALDEQVNLAFTTSSSYDLREKASLGQSRSAVSGELKTGMSTSMSRSDEAQFCSAELEAVLAPASLCIMNHFSL